MKRNHNAVESIMLLEPRKTGSCEEPTLPAGTGCEYISKGSVGYHCVISAFRIRKSPSFLEELIGIYIPDTLSGIADHVPFSQSLPGSSEPILQSNFDNRFATVDFAY